MFIMPVGNRVDWKTPPVITLILILINCIVFFFLQAGDDRQDIKAIAFYYTTDLPGIEFSRYQSYLELNSIPAAVEKFKAAIPKQDGSALIVMENNSKFMKELHAGHIITLAMPEYAKWHELRNSYESMGSFTDRYLYRVGISSWVNIFTSAFLHGDFDHLFGNMVVLFLVGFLVESVVGKGIFLTTYLASAYAAKFMFSLTGDGSLLGASGAISGIMGIYTVVYGLRKIDFFYSIGFYFDYVRAPAIVLLPLWLGNEVYQHLSNHGSGVAYMSHFGGLACGALIGFLYRLFRPKVLNDIHAAVTDSELEQVEFQKGMDYLGTLEFKKALPIFKRLHEKHPEDHKILRLFYRAAKADPGSEDFHRAALQLLTVSAKDNHQAEQLNTLFHEYMDSVKPFPKFDPELIVQLAKRFTGTGYSNDAEKLVKWLQNSSPHHADLPMLLLLLTRGFYHERNNEKAEETRQLLLATFPDSNEASTAIAS